MPLTIEQLRKATPDIRKGAAAEFKKRSFRGQGTEDLSRNSAYQNVNRLHSMLDDPKYKNDIQVKWLADGLKAVGEAIADGKNVERAEKLLSADNMDGVSLREHMIAFKRLYLTNPDDPKYIRDEEERDQLQELFRRTAAGLGITFGMDVPDEFLAEAESVRREGEKVSAEMEKLAAEERRARARPNDPVAAASRELENRRAVRAARQAEWPNALQWIDKAKEELLTPAQGRNAEEKKEAAVKAYAGIFAARMIVNTEGGSKSYLDMAMDPQEHQKLQQQLAGSELFRDFVERTGAEELGRLLKSGHGGNVEKSFRSYLLNADRLGDRKEVGSGLLDRYMPSALERTEALQKKIAAPGFAELDGDRQLELYAELMATRASVSSVRGKKSTLKRPVLKKGLQEEYKRLTTEPMRGILREAMKAQNFRAAALKGHGGAMDDLFRAQVRADGMSGETPERLAVQRRYELTRKKEDERLLDKKADESRRFCLPVTSPRFQPTYAERRKDLSDILSRAIPPETKKAKLAEYLLLQQMCVRDGDGVPVPDAPIMDPEGLNRGAAALAASPMMGRFAAKLSMDGELQGLLREDKADKLAGYFRKNVAARTIPAGELLSLEGALLPTVGERMAALGKIVAEPATALTAVGGKEKIPPKARAAMEMGVLYQKIDDRRVKSEDTMSRSLLRDVARDMRKYDLWYAEREDFKKFVDGFGDKKLDNIAESPEIGPGLFNGEIIKWETNNPEPPRLRARRLIGDLEADAGQMLQSGAYSEKLPEMAARKMLIGKALAQYGNDEKGLISALSEQKLREGTAQLLQNQEFRTMCSSRQPEQLARLVQGDMVELGKAFGRGKEAQPPEAVQGEIQKAEELEKPEHQVQPLQ